MNPNKTTNRGLRFWFKYIGLFIFIIAIIIIAIVTAPKDRHELLMWRAWGIGIMAPLGALAIGLSVRKYVIRRKLKLHDGYFVDKDGLITFYTDSALDRVLAETRYEFAEDAVAHYEGICIQWRQNFSERGLLRLNTPLDYHQEYLSTDFLYVPPKERARIENMIQDNLLITVERGKTFALSESGKQITLEELVGSGELIDIMAIGEESVEKLKKGIITETEIENMKKEFEENKFYLLLFQFEDFTEKKSGFWWYILPH